MHFNLKGIILFEIQQEPTVKVCNTVQWAMLGNSGTAEHTSGGPSPTVQGALGSVL